MSEPVIISVPYRRDSSRLMANLLDLPCPVMLDSCNHNLQGGRYDLLSAVPLATLEIEDGVLSCSEALPHESAEDPFAAAELLLERHRPQSSGREQPLPFNGGMIGVLGYPGITSGGRITVEQGFIGIYPWALVVDHH